MLRRTAAAMIVCGMLVVLAGSPADAQRQQAPMDLLDAMATGQVDATFYGNGDQSVIGHIRRGSFGPQVVQVAPGTQFQGQQPGVQGMGTLGSTEIDLSRRRFAQVQIPTACTDYDLPAPTRAHRMIPGPPLDGRMVALSETVAYVRPSREVAQIAVWAIANNPEWSEIEEWAQERARTGDEERRAEIAATYRQQAAQLVYAAGMNPLAYQMFR